MRALRASLGALPSAGTTVVAVVGRFVVVGRVVVAVGRVVAVVGAGAGDVASLPGAARVVTVEPPVLVGFGVGDLPVGGGVDVVGPPVVG